MGSLVTGRGAVSVGQSGQIKVLFFASLREDVGIGALNIDAASTETVMSTLEGVLSERAYAAISEPNVRIAVNQTLIEGTVTLAPGDEVAFLPPVTGG